MIVITGASKGLGRAIAEKFADAGNHVFVCARNEYQLYKMIEETQTAYPQSTIKGKPVDVSKKDEVVAFTGWCLQFGVPDVIVNNAGQFLPGSVHTEAEGVLQQMIEGNLYSAYYITRAFLPRMIEERRGHIFNMCSIASFQAYANGGSYSISKFALLGFSKNLREELKDYNIKVTAVMPGAAYTGSWKASGINENRFMQPDDVASMIYAASQLSPQACVEDIILRPQQGDI